MSSREMGFYLFSRLTWQCSGISARYEFSFELPRVTQKQYKQLHVQSDVLTKCEINLDFRI
jgi:hypothetical protein